MTAIPRDLSLVLLGLGAALACSKSPSPSPRAEPAGARVQAVELAPGVELGDEFVLDAPTYEKASLAVSSPRFGNGAYLVAYEYDRTYVTRVDLDGQVLDPWGIPLMTARAAPVVGFDGSNWLAVAPVSLDPSTFVRELRCARVQADGTVLDPDGATVNADTAAAGQSYLFFDGSKFLFVAGLEWQFIDTSCAPIGAPFSPLGGTEPLSLTFDGTGYVALYAQPSLGNADVSSLWVKHLSASGVVEGAPVLIDDVDAGKFPLIKFQVGGALASHLGTTVIAYHYGAGASVSTIRYREIPATGAPSAALTLAIAPTNERQPVIVPTDDGFVVASPGGDDRLDRVSFDEAEFLSAALPATALPSAGGGSDGERLLVEAADQVTALDENLAPLGAAVPLLQVAETETDPQVATSPDTALVVFNGRLAGLVGERTSKAGELLDPTPLSLGTFPWNGSAVTSNGTDFLVAWDNPSPYRINVRRVAANGDLDAPIELGTDVDPLVQQYFPRLASNGSDYLVTWWRSANTAVDDALVGTRISASGAVLDATPLPLLHRYPGAGLGLAVAFDGSSYVLAQGDDGAAPIQIGHLDPDNGTVSWAPTPWTGFVRSLAWGTDQGLLVFHTSSNLFAARLDGAGNALDDPAIAVADTCCGASNYDIGAVTWDGSVYWTARIDKLLATSPLVLARVSTEGELLDPTGLTVIPDRHDWASYAGGFALASWGPTSLLAYSREDLDPAFRSARVRARLLQPEASGAGAAGMAGDGSGGQSGAGGTGATSGGTPTVGGAGPVGGGGTSGSATGGTGASSGGGEAGEGGAGAMSQGGTRSAGGAGNATGSGGAGRSGSAGRSSNAGRSSTAGTTGRAGASGSGNPTTGDEGCGCQVPKRKSEPIPSLLLAVGALTLVSRRRRKRPVPRWHGHFLSAVLGSPAWLHQLNLRSSPAPRRSSKTSRP